ncbi:hypothetical protein H2199_007812 [Coniosporium tulheliwenetii]|uniref:Uncharacterized protein n=1 Tax=Coniosporium tulheliwenetii TaxID=3383036 RepID=A0ACC2YNU1_9PEZI|nr:hypothetical protein H2199_007812 [Cladosporium sp. JES 115]
MEGQSNLSQFYGAKYEEARRLQLCSCRRSTSNLPRPAKSTAEASQKKANICADSSYSTQIYLSSIELVATSCSLRGGELRALRYYEEMLRNSPDHEDYSRLVDHARSVLEQARSDQVNEIEVEVEADEEDEEGEEDTAAGASQSEETTERAQEQ